MIPTATGQDPIAASSKNGLASAACHSNARHTLGATQVCWRRQRMPMCLRTLSLCRCLAVPVTGAGHGSL